ncbi:MAG: serine hydrolase [Bacteroidetes bacterium]|nr:serine hydrolase [Bacteroidota bacterium]
MKNIVALLLCLLTISSFAQKGKTSEDKRFAGLDTAFARVLNEWHAAGFAVAVVEKNKVVYAKGFGYRDYENKIPVTTNTLFAIGSCTKAFTASLLGMLNKDGKVDFDKPVRNYLPELKFYNDELNDHVTLRDMMCHRTGLPRHDYSWYLFQTHSMDTLMHRIQFLKPSADIRQIWQYNNFMFMLQGMVAEKITGKSWEDNIRQKIFQPLGMDSSDVTLAEWEKSSDAAFGYDVVHDSIIKKMDYYDIAAMSPAGSINSSVNDMAKWLVTWIHGGKYNGKEIIPASYTTQAMSSQMVIGAGLPSKEEPDIFLSNYGFGWFIDSYRGHYRVNHGGNIDGFSANTCFFPSDSIGIVVLANQNGSPVPSIIRNIITDRMLGLKYLDWQSKLKRTADSAKVKQIEALRSIVSDQKQNTKTSHELKSYEGSYSNPGYGIFDIILKNDSLLFSAGAKLFWLRHYHYDVFTAFFVDPKDGVDTSDASTKMQFHTNIHGDIESASINLEPSVEPIVFTRTLKAREISKDSLQAYVGNYEISGVNIRIYTKGGDILYMFVTGQPEYELVPIENDKFSLKNLNGFSVQFNRNEKGEVIEMLSIQPNGTFRAIRKNE